MLRPAKLAGAHGANTTAAGAGGGGGDVAQPEIKTTESDNKRSIWEYEARSGTVFGVCRRAEALEANKYASQPVIRFEAPQISRPNLDWPWYDMCV